MSNNHGHWETKEALDPAGKYGFVYQITFTLTNQKYVGKKAYWSYNRSGTRKLKESKWRDYTSSSVDLNALIKEYGKEWFLFEIVTECCTKSCWSYMESNIMHKWDVLTLRDNHWGERVYLNKAINKVQWIPKHCSAVIKINNVKT